MSRAHKYEEKENKEKQNQDRKLYQKFNTLTGIQNLNPV